MSATHLGIECRTVETLCEAETLALVWNGALHTSATGQLFILLLTDDGTERINITIERTGDVS